MTDNEKIVEALKYCLYQYDESCGEINWMEVKDRNEIIDLINKQQNNKKGK